jgi:heme exporter protein D
MFLEIRKMVFLTIACMLAVVVPVGHSVLSQKIFLKPLALENHPDGALSSDVAKRLTFAMFHFASVCWLGMGVSILTMLWVGELHRSTLFVFAAVYALSGLGNFWSVRQPHPGGIMLCTISGLILAALNFT